MAQNREGAGCPHICSFDKYVKEHKLDSFGHRTLAFMRGALRDKLSAETKQALGDSWQDKIATVNKELSEGNLSQESKEFIDNYVDFLQKVLNDEAKMDVVKEYSATAGISNTEISAKYKILTQKIPLAAYRQEAISQIVAIALEIISMYEDHPNYRNYTTEEILQTIGMTNLAKMIQRKLQLKYLNQEIKNGKIVDIADDSRRVEWSEDSKFLFECLLKDKEVWSAAAFFAEKQLGRALGVRISSEYNYVESEEEGQDTVDENGDVQDAEVQAPEHWMTSTDKISAYHSLANDTRAILHRIRGSKVGMLGFPVIEDVMATYDDLMTSRAMIASNDSRKFVEMLQTESANPGEEWKAQLVKILSKDSYKRTTFFNNFRKNMSNYVYHNTKRVEGGVQIFRHTNSEEEKILKFETWASKVIQIDDENTRCICTRFGAIDPNNLKAFKDLFAPKLDSTTGVFEDEIPTIDENGNYNTDAWYRDPIDGTKKAPETEQDKKEAKRQFILDANDFLNLKMEEKTIEELLTNEGKFKEFSHSLYEVAIALSKLKATDTLLTIATKDNIKRYMSGLMGVAITAPSVFSKKSPVEKSIRFGKSTYMTATTPSTIGDMLEGFKRAIMEGKQKGNAAASLREYIEKTYFNCPIFASKTTDENTGKVTYDIHHMWLKELYNSTNEDIDRSDSFVSTFLTSLTRGLGKDDTEWEQFSEKDNYIFNMHEYLHEYQESMGKFGVVPLFVTGDSNATRSLKVPHRTPREIVNYMLTMVDCEMERMLMMDTINEYCKDNDYTPSAIIEKKKSMWTVLDFLNENPDIDVESLKEKYRNRDTQEGLIAWEAAKESLRNVIQNSLNASFEVFKKDLIDKEIAKAEAAGSAIINDETMLETGELDGKKINKAGVLQDIYYNMKLNLMLQLQLTTVDPGFYNGTQDLQKRYKEMIAAGTPLDLGAMDRQRNPSNPDEFIEVPYMKDGETDVMQNVVFGEEIKKSYEEESNGEEIGQAFKDAEYKSSVVDKYKKSTLTDGQAFREFTSYRMICRMAGGSMWSDAHETAYWKIMEFRSKNWDRTTEEGKKAHAQLIKELEDLNVVFQPIKPFFFGFERPFDGAMIPQQLKYSEYPVIPELLPLVPIKNENGEVTGWKESKLAALGRAMAETGIHLYADSSCVKVGLFGQIDAKSFTSFEEFRAAFDTSSEGPKNKNGNPATHVHKLPLSGYRVQNTVPEHINSSRALGSQIQQHAYILGEEGVHDVKDYPFISRLAEKGDGHVSIGTEKIDCKNGISVRDCASLYTALASARYIKSFFKFIKKYSSTQTLIKTISELRANDSRAPLDSLASITANEDGTDLAIPLSEGAAAYDNMATLTSSFRKEIIKQRTKGGSAVQVSAYGYEDILKVKTEKTKDGKMNITTADTAIAFDFSYTDSAGQEVHLSYTDYVDPNTGCLLGVDGKTIVEQPAEPEKGVPGREYYGWNTKMGSQFPGSLDILAYRIPTEKGYSILNLRVKRFFPKTAGGIIMVPTMFTTVAGFDFDIDKLYLFYREFREKQITKREQQNIVGKVWRDIYGKKTNKSEGTSEIYKRLKAAKEKAEAGLEEGSGEVVASAQTSGAANTLGDVPQFKELLERVAPITSEEDAIEETEEEIAETDELKLANETHEKLFQYWDQAGLSASKEDGGLGMTAQEYYENYFNQNRQKYIGFIEYDSKKSPTKNHQVAINNVIFDFIKSRLEDYSTFKERFTPGGFQHLKDCKGEMLILRYADKETLKEILDSQYPVEALRAKATTMGTEALIKYSPTELSTIAHYQTYNAMYDKLIGMAANNAINLRITAHTDVLELKEPIRWGQMLDKKDTDDKVGRDLKEKIKGGIDTELSVVEYLSGAVDAVKDALIEFFGVDPNNFNVAVLAARIGASPEDIGLLLNQPVVQRAIRECQEHPGIKFSEALLTSLNDMFGNEIANNGIRDIRQMEASTRLRYLTSDELTKHSILGRLLGENEKINNNNFVLSQCAVISLLSELAAAAQELNDQVATSKFTSQSSVSATTGSIEATEQKVIKFSQTFGGPESKFKVSIPGQTAAENGTVQTIDPNLRIEEGKEDELLTKCARNPWGMQQITYSAIMTFLDDVIGTLFPIRSEGSKHLKNVLAKLSSNGKLPDKCYDDINRDTPVACAMKMLSIFRADTTRVECFKYKDANGNEKSMTFEGIPPVIFYNVVFPQMMSLIINADEFKEEVGKYAILSGLTTPTQSNGTVVLKFDSVGKLEDLQKDTIISSWAEMLNSDNPTIRDLSLQLMLYSFFNSGWSFGPTSMMSLVPTVLKLALQEQEDVKYLDFFNKMFNLSVNKDGSTETFYIASTDQKAQAEAMSVKQIAKSFILNHYKKYNVFRKMASKGAIKKITSLPSWAASGGRSFTLDFSAKDPNAQGLTGYANITRVEGKIESISYIPVIVIGKDIYMCDKDVTDKVGDSEFNVSKGAMTYYKVDAPIGFADYSGVNPEGTAVALLNAALGERKTYITQYDTRNILAALNKKFDLVPILSSMLLDTTANVEAEKGVTEEKSSGDLLTNTEDRSSDSHFMLSLQSIIQNLQSYSKYDLLEYSDREKCSTAATVLNDELTGLHSKLLSREKLTKEEKIKVAEKANDLVSNIHGLLKKSMAIEKMTEQLVNNAKIQDEEKAPSTLEQQAKKSEEGCPENRCKG